MDIFKESGITSGLVNLGGNVQALGTKTDRKRLAGCGTESGRHGGLSGSFIHSG